MDNPMNTVRKLYEKYRSVILYVFFGGCTTLVNVTVYYLCYNVAGIGNVPATIIAWLIVVTLAFITNKIWVFNSKNISKEVVLREVWSFFSARIATGLLNVGIMYVAVDVMHWNSILWKLISSIIVVILNYFASKLFVFRNKKKKGSSEMNADYH